ncbi:MAG: peptidase S41 [Cytophagales bacterium]|nr:MAG: peptidase S41 [Cytophagales bacterium]
MNNTLLRHTTLLTGLAASLLFTACKRDPEVQPVAVVSPPTFKATSGPVTDGEVNNWILENMKYYYLWNDKLPQNPNTNLTPDQFFLSLLYDRNNTTNTNRDRFSWLQQSADELKASLSGVTKTTGMEFRLYFRDASQSSVVGAVIYVLPGSPASFAGVKRGDVFTRVNGETLTNGNYASLLYNNAENFNFTFAKASGSTYTEDKAPKSIQAILFQSDPVLLDTTYSVGGRTVGYVMYNQFVPGPNGSTTKTYDLKLDNIFAKFKTKGVNELILDLRYNRGGYVSSSTNLASLIGKNVTGKVFYAQEWNSNVMPYYDKQYGVGWNKQNFVDKSQNIGANLSRVIVLTTSSTASASELVINGLKPFMNVITVGTTTTGKNVGSITISDPNNRIKWGIQPLTFRSVNADGTADYGTGFIPKVEVREGTTDLKPLGSTADPLISEAIFQLTGTRMARQATVPLVSSDLPLSSSIDRQAGGGNMFAEPIR